MIRATDPAILNDMIIGLGIDLIELGRLRKTVKRFGERFLKRIYSEEEIAYCYRKVDPVPSLAGRFAVKEAAMKALGTGFSQGVFFKDIQVTRNPGQAPTLRFEGGARRRAEKIGVLTATISITHERDMGAAVVILEGKEGG